MPILKPMCVLALQQYLKINDCIKNLLEKLVPLYRPGGCFFNQRDHVLNRIFPVN